MSDSKLLPSKSDSFWIFVDGVSVVSISWRSVLILLGVTAVFFCRSSTSVTAGTSKKCLT